jgi:NAD dependent epimerase/dehydratase family enzyme
VLEHVDDVDRAIAEIARVPKPSGVFFFDTINRTWRSNLLAINAVAPGIVNNLEFTKALARQLRRPPVWAAPKWLVRAVVGKERASILLEGQHVVPRRTLEAGYRFRYPTVQGAMADLLPVII